MSLRTWIPLLLLAAALASVSEAPAASIGLYADPAGTTTLLSPDYSRVLSDDLVFVTVYVVVFAEDTVNAAAFDVEIAPAEFDAYQTILIGASYGPDGDGISINTDEGYHVGLGSCVPGYGGVAAQVARLEFALVFSGRGAWTAGFQWSAELRPSVLEHPTQPVYSNCSGELTPIDEVSGIIYYQGPVANETVSWGAVKNLYERP